MNLLIENVDREVYRDVSQIFDCSLCFKQFPSIDQLFAHFEGHFSPGKCGDCDHRLILINNNFYCLQLHDTSVCDAEKLKRDQSSCEPAWKELGEVDIKEEITIEEVFGCGDSRLERNASRKRLEKVTPSKKTEYNGRQKFEVEYVEVADGFAVKVENEAPNSVRRSSRQREGRSSESKTKPNSQLTDNIINSSKKNTSPSSQLKSTKYVPKLSQVQCEICDTILSSNRNLLNHMKIKHSVGEVPVKAPSIQLPPKIVKKLKPTVPFQCDICKRHFLAKRGLILHLNGKHSANIPIKISIRKRKPPTSVQCDVCKQNLASKRSLIYHMQMKHSASKDIKKNVCDICGMGLKTLLNLRRHKELHEGIIKFVCSFCGKGFHHKHNMQEHSNLHTGVKPYKCTVCSKPFGRKNALNIHMRVHTGAKPFKCTVEGCERAYAHNSDLKRHLYGKHRIYTKKFECPICSKIFPENKLLTRHLKTHESRLDIQLGMLR